MAKKFWIKGAIKHPGALHRALGVPQGQKIPATYAGKMAEAAKAKVRLGKMGRLAKTLKKF